MPPLQRNLAQNKLNTIHYGNTPIPRPPSSLARIPLHPFPASPPLVSTFSPGTPFAQTNRRRCWPSEKLRIGNSLELPTNPLIPFSLFLGSSSYAAETTRPLLWLLSPPFSLFLFLSLSEYPRWKSYWKRMRFLIINELHPPVLFDQEIWGRAYYRTGGIQT